MLTNTGLAEFARLLATSSYYFAVGSGDPPPPEGLNPVNTPATPEDTALVAEFMRQEFDTLTRSGAVITGNVNVEMPAAETVKEFGVFLSSTGGVMAERVTVPEATAEAGDTLTVVWTLEVKRAS